MIREKSQDEIIRKTDENSKSEPVTQIKRLSYSSGNSSDSSSNNYEQFNEVLKKEGIENFSDLQRKIGCDDSNLIKTVETLRKKYFTDEEFLTVSELENKIDEDPQDILSLNKAGTILKEISLRLLESKNEEEVLFDISIISL